ncbi:MAG: hypothetical protein Q9201_007559 [Fulgogasparrea decipioides]
MPDQNISPAVGQKRKRLPDSSNASKSNRNVKRVKTIEARSILAQASDKALNQNGDLDVAAFVKAREFEIKAVEASMESSKKSLSSRAFQQVPNELRRRTASHNVKKVPKRLRNRAAREMKEDNTPTMTLRHRKPTPRMRLRLETAKKLQKLNARAKKKGDKAKEQEPAGTHPGQSAASIFPVKRLKKNALSKPDEPTAKFRKRQNHKSWLPTHIFHAKRAHMTEPKRPLWRFAIPLSPTEKSYRKTHRAVALRGCVAWDTSYLSTIALEGVEASLLVLLRGLGVDEEALSGKRMSKWRRGTRSWHGWVRERDGQEKWIAEVDFVWCVEAAPSPVIEGSATTSKKRKRKCLLRAHPSAFLQLWTEILKAAKMQRPPVMVEDLRFEIGSLELTGPGSTETLVAALEPFKNNDGASTEDVSAKVWSLLGSVTNPSCLPLNAVLGFNVSDPRIHHPPRTLKPPTSESANDELNHTLADWPPDRTQIPPSIFDRTARLTASRQLPSQKAINRRKGDALPGEYPVPAVTDPQIPTLLMALRSPTTGAQGSWTLLLPWKCVLPVWYHVMHYPLSTGGNPRFGGLQETRQLAFEQGIPWFPGDFPGTQAGWEWELRERERRKAEWEKRPKGKKVAWESLDLGKGRKGEIGMGWACDWEYLFIPASRLVPGTASQATTKDSSTTGEEPSKPAEAEISASKAQETDPPPHPMHHIPIPHSTTLLASSNPSSASKDVTTIHLTLLSRGNPTTCARIYRLPTSDHQLRSQWLVLASAILHPPKETDNTNRPSAPDRKVITSLPRNESHHLRTQQTAISLLHPPEIERDTPIQSSNPSYPCVPDAQDLVGFVTTGNFDLGQGKASAIGCIAITKVAHQQQQRPYEPLKADASGATDSVTTDGENEMMRRSMEGLEKKLGKKTVQRLCIVREAGQSVGRLARWDLV